LETINRHALVIIGTLKSGNPIFENSYDPLYQLNEGEFKAIQMRLFKHITSTNYLANSVHKLDNGYQVYTGQKSHIGIIRLYLFILKAGVFDEILLSKISKVVDRGGIYTGKKFLSEVFEESLEDTVEVSIDPEFLLNNPTVDNLERFSYYISSQDVSVKPVEIFKLISKMFTVLEDTMDVDIMLDGAFSIANKYLNNLEFDYSTFLFGEIAKWANKSSRLSLEITCRIRNARIIRMKEMGDYIRIIEVISAIDDGSLEVVSQEDREEYYCLNGYAYSKLGEAQIAEDFYEMAVMISEEEVLPSMHVAEARVFLAKNYVKKYELDFAIREFLTASSIARGNTQTALASYYSHLAAIEEMKLGSLLAGSGITHKIYEDISQAKFSAWESLKRIVASIKHSHKNLRKKDLYPKFEESKSMITNIFSQDEENKYSQMVHSILEILTSLVETNISEAMESDILKDTAQQISSMLPLPSPVVMIIALDGRLVVGGEIGMDSWAESVMEDDDLFSGALSAIMAVFSEVLSEDQPLRMIDLGQTQVMIEKSAVCIGALLIDRDMPIIRKALQDSLNFIETNYQELLDWDGYSLDLSGIKPKLEEYFIKAREDITQISD